MTENFSNLGKETEIQIKEVQTVPNKMNSERPKATHNKLSKVKDTERLLKAGREKQLVTHKGDSIRL